MVAKFLLCHVARNSTDTEGFEGGVGQANHARHAVHHHHGHPFFYPNTNSQHRILDGEDCAQQNCVQQTLAVAKQALPLRRFRRPSALLGLVTTSIDSHS